MSDRFWSAIFSVIVCCLRVLAASLQVISAMTGIRLKAGCRSHTVATPKEESNHLYLFVFSLCREQEAFDETAQTWMEQLRSVQRQPTIIDKLKRTTMQ